MRKLLGIALVAVSAGSAAAQSCDVIAANLFKQVRDEKYAEAVEQAFATNPYSSGMKDTIVGVASQLTSSIAMMGKYRSHVELVRKDVADRYTYLYYFVAFDRQPMKFGFHCYRAVDKWCCRTSSSPTGSARTSQLPRSRSSLRRSDGRDPVQG